MVRDRVTYLACFSLEMNNPRIDMQIRSLLSYFLPIEKKSNSKQYLTGYKWFYGFRQGTIPSGSVHVDKLGQTSLPVSLPTITKQIRRGC